LVVVDDLDDVVVVVRFLLVLRLVPEEVLHHLVPRLLLHEDATCTHQRTQSETKFELGGAAVGLERGSTGATQRSAA
jgi:hypothetical protein